ncbi:MAG: transposase [Planctomycetes bacterium]|nr:transposase [Planctomycetota bacterium]MBE7463078.1 transposase [Planctomycetota bacterium]
MDDREVLCLAVLQELLDFESDHHYQAWLHSDPLMRRLLSRQNFANRRALQTPLLACLTQGFCAMHADDQPPFSSSTPIRSMSAVPSAPASGNVLADWRSGVTARRSSAGSTAYASPLIFSTKGYIAHVQQIPGNRHDVQGLYALLKTAFEGHLLGDNAYWPKREKRAALERQNIRVTAASRSNWQYQHAQPVAESLRRHRSSIERRIGLFDRQFHTQNTLNRSRRHYEARRWTKALAHNLSRHVNHANGWPQESLAHYRLAS